MSDHSDLNQRNKQQVWDLWNAMDRADDGDLLALLEPHLDPQAPWHGPQPIGTVIGAKAYVDSVWRPMRRAFKNLQRESFIFMGGLSSGRVDGRDEGHYWVGATGTFHGRFEQPYLGIPPNGEDIAMRFGEFARLENGRIVESYALFDFVDLMEQAGINVLPPSRGRPGLYPAPKANDGVLLAQQDDAVSDYTLDHIRRFVFGTLNDYDESDLKSMGMADFFEPDIAWYGPGGIGACLSLADFQQLHQGPWLNAFPDRRVLDLTALIGEGEYSGSPGWSGVKATHRGEYLGVAATGNALAINGLDFWKRSGERYLENWVFVDMVHLFAQMGVDLFARMREQSGGAA